MTGSPDISRLLARKGEAAPAAKPGIVLSNPGRFATLRLPARPVAPTETRAKAAAAPRPARVGVTLRLDQVRHQRLRHIAQTNGRSMQAVLHDAFDAHVTGLPDAGDGLPVLLVPPRWKIG